jgi:hypothetical protein
MGTEMSICRWFIFVYAASEVITWNSVCRSPFSSMEKQPEVWIPFFISAYTRSPSPSLSAIETEASYSPPVNSMTSNEHEPITSFVAISGFGNLSNVAATSLDGITWTQQALTSSQKWQGLAFGDGIFVATALDSTVVDTSPSGISWTQRTAPAPYGFHSVAYGEGSFVAIGDGYASGSVATSP